MKHCFKTLLSIALSLSLASSVFSQTAKWDVTEDHANAKDVKFTTDEGTWMNLDVSPDGKSIVFDLMGDIYIMHLNGGTAKLVSGGPAFEVQPRFSPDGKRLSFTSDRAGGDNIWTMNLDGSDPVQISKEHFRMLNNSTWSPDGKYIVAKKHFSSGRSLGSGEMWMFHVSGGLSGIQLTKRKNEQQDVGMPSFSPDGKYLYFSEDMSGGDYFEYNKDPNGQIFTVRRLDMESGKLISVIGGAGGATRPQPSPDGKYIAFVKRVRLKSVLYLQDIATGAEIPLFDGLSHDQQEAWAIFGTYPNFNWTPDSKNIVIWAGGKILNIDVASKSTKVIPFKVNASVRITEAARYKQDVFTDRIDAKMIRNTVTTPDGKNIIFNGAGYLWKKSLPNGTPKRLTTGTDFEYFPSISKDGNWVVYSTWNDKDLGTIYKTSINNENTVKITKEKGYYYSPSFSNDGTKIIYRKGGGDSMLGNIHSTKQGLYITDADGTSHKLFLEKGSAPFFGIDDDKVYFNQGKSLRSIDLDGKNEKTYFTSKYGKKFVVSPDENWVAFQELFNVYVAPFVKSSSSVALSGNTNALPVKKVSQHAGDFLHWSADSKKLHWTLGPEYFTREIDETFNFADNSSSIIDGPEEIGIQIGLKLTADKPEGIIALMNARIITMRGNEVIDDGTIIVEKNKITAIGQSSTINIPADALKIDLSGRTIMPGLVDSHAHIGTSWNKITPNQQWSYYANLAFGVTTIHDPSTDTEMVFSQSEMVKAGYINGPRIYSTGTILYGAEGDFKAVVNNYDDAYSHLARMKAVGAFSVKSYNQPRREQRQQILKAARELNMLVVPEGGSTLNHNLTHVIDGHTSVEHNIPVAPVYKDILTVWGSSNVTYTPTLIVNYGGITGEYYWYQNTNVWENKHLLSFTPRTIVDSRSRRRLKLPDDDFSYQESSKAAKALSDAGVNVEMGAHGQLQGLGAHWEMWMFEQGGMSPIEAIRASTLNGAKMLGMDSEIGSLDTGKLADLIILDKNPLVDIQNSQFVNRVMINGRLFDAATMNEIGNHPKTRLPFYWENPLTNESSMLDMDELVRAGLKCSCHSHQ